MTALCLELLLGDQADPSVPGCSSSGSYTRYATIAVQSSMTLSPPRSRHRDRASATSNRATSFGMVPFEASAWIMSITSWLLMNSVMPSDTTAKYLGVCVMRAELYEYLAQESATVHGYVPENTWVVYARWRVVTGALAQELASSVVPLEPGDKIAPEWSAVLSVGEATSTGGGAAVSSDGTDDPDGDGQAATAALLRGSTSSTSEAQQWFASAESGGVTKYIVTAQIFGATAAATRALAARLSELWQRPLTDSVRSAAQQRDAARRSAPASTAAGGGAAPPPDALTTSACTPGLRPRGRLLQAVVCTADVAAALRWLAAQPEVHWLEPTPRLRRHDIWGDLLVQSGGRGLTAATVAQPTRVAAHRMWSAGLDGSSQLIGISDTGVDTDSCYFFDPQVPDVWRRLVADPTRTGAKVFKSTTHRKLASYYAFSG
ncbi:hypothetical protein GPECTOR_1g582 [Gonium pectorale]|uniref:Peptidase S8/S53 domain-containing protein n=1 Tax=Gonium pectorale TaxID=33097 RepID=A0A150H398_GONPE|nr:hypothetical protein GPECTOR_1g582 [Gonium pectorale]|eukprot:KXZ56646.1 hypothetical protein GPECTOR_1g582 [Gonium pectorale]